MQSRDTHSLIISGMVLFVGLCLSYFVVANYQQTQAEFRQTRFQSLVDKTYSHLQERVLSYEYGLRGMRGAFLAAGPSEMTRQKFRLVFESRDLAKEFPGSRGFGYIQRVLPSNEKDFLLDVAKRDHEVFQIRQLSENSEERFVIKYLEPEALNRSAIGLDIGSESNRRAAMLKAIRSGRASITRPITLVQANGFVGQGFLLLLALYPEYPIAKDEVSREATALGATYTPLVIEEVLENINPIGDGVSLSLSDVDSSAGNVVFYRAGKAIESYPELAITRRFDVFGREWLAEFRATPQFAAGVPKDDSLALGAIGITVSLLLALLVFRQLHSRVLLRRTSERLQVLVQQAPVALAMFNRQMQYLAVSQRWIDDFGLHGQDLIGVSCCDLFPNAPQSWREIHKKALAGEEVSNHSEQFEREDGSLRWLEWGVRPWHGADGDIGGVVIFSEDVTERHKLIFELEQARDAAEAANRAKTLFIDNMTHEMRTPIHQISGIASLISRDAQTEKQKRQLALLGTAITRLNAMVNSVLTVVDLESRMTSIQLKSIDIGETVGGVMALMTPRAEEKQLTIGCHLDPFPSDILGDTRHLKTILACFLNNAINYTNRGTITVRALLQNQSDSAATLRIEVQDEGEGIAPEVMSKLFEYFEQADNSHTRKHGGLGVGLGIVKKLTRLLDGDAGCESTLGVGSTFWATVVLPKAAHREPDATQVATEDFHI